MIPRTRTLPLSGLRSVHNERTRIFAAGGDPYFGRDRLRQMRRDMGLTSAPSPESRLWRSDLLDRLQPTVTRRPE